MGKYYFLLPVTILCIFTAFQAMDFPVHDFANYYFGGLFLKDGNFGPWAYFPFSFNKAISELGYHQIYVAYAPNTPFLTLLFTPFALIPLALSKLLFNIVSIVLFIFSLGRLYSYYKIKPLYFFIIPVIFFTSIKNNILFGQVYFLLFFLLTEAWLSYEVLKYKRVAVFLSISIMLKIFPIIFILIFLFKKQYKLVLYIVLSCVVLTVIAILFTGMDVWIFYLKDVLPSASKGEISGAFVDNYQSVFMFLKRLLIFDAELNPDAAGFPALFHAKILGIKILLIAAGYYLTRNIKDNLWIFSYWIFSAFFVTPYGSTYGFIILLFPLFAIWKSNVSNNKKIAFITIVALINNIPAALLSTLLFPFSYLRLLLLFALFCVFISDQIKNSEWRLSIAIAASSFLLSLIFFRESSNTTKQMLGKNSPLLVFDYKVDSKLLHYSYWDLNGRNEATIPIEILGQGRALTDLEIFKANKQLTFDNSKIMKPMIFDNTKIIYLSDYGRGIGFYTIRILDINRAR